MALEIRESFTSLDDWLAWCEANPIVHNADYIHDVARSVRLGGLVDPVAGMIPAREVEGNSSNYREGLRARGATCRYRALEILLLDYLLTNGWCSSVLLSEHVTDFAHEMRKLIPFIYTSEYIANPMIRARMSHVTHEDPVRLTLPNNSFDMYICPDTIVYAQSLDGLMREARRVLRRGGQFLATFPFRYGESATEIFAEHTNGELVYYTQPIYHSDPLSGTRSRLLYFMPGWDILDFARIAGFRTAEIVAMSSRTYAILGAEIATIFVLKATA